MTEAFKPFAQTQSYFYRQGVFHKQRISSSCEASVLSIQLKVCPVKKQLLHRITVEIIWKKYYVFAKPGKNFAVFKLRYTARITLKYPFKRRLLGHSWMKNS